MKTSKETLQRHCRCDLQLVNTINTVILSFDKKTFKLDYVLDYVYCKYVRTTSTLLTSISMAKKNRGWTARLICVHIPN